MKITKERLKEIIKDVLREETEYQKFFANALKKSGKSIPQMSDEEKKEDKPIDDLVIYITSPRSIQSNEGFFQIHISSFNPIREIRINEENYKIDNLSYEYSHDYANRKLNPGENNLIVEVTTDTGKIEKEFKIEMKELGYL